MIELIEWAGCIIGLCGAALLATNSRHSAWGWVLFILSNAAWIAYGLLTHANGLVVQQLGFTVTSLMGIWKWLVVPRLALKSIHKNGG